MSVRSEVGWQERCDMPRGCCENGEEAEPRSGGGRALGAEEGASGGDQQMRLTSLSSLMEGIRVADGLRSNRLSLCMGAQGVRGRAILETATGRIGKSR